MVDVEFELMDAGKNIINNIFTHVFRKVGGML